MQIIIILLIFQFIVFDQQLLLLLLVIILLMGSKQLPLSDQRQQFNIVYENMAFSIVPHTQRIISLKLFDKTSHELYETKNFELKYINIKTIIMALQGKNPDMKISTSKNNLQSLSLLIITLTIKSPLIADIKQEITCQLIQKLQQNKVLLQNLKDIKSKLNDLKQIDTTKFRQKLFYLVHQSEQKQVNYARDSIDVASLNLSEGNYILTISFFLKVTNQWIYGGLKFADGDISHRTILFGDHQGFYLQNNWEPIKSTASINITNKEQKITFELFSGTSYPSKVKNFIMTAQKII